MPSIDAKATEIREFLKGTKRTMDDVIGHKQKQLKMMDGQPGIDRSATTKSLEVFQRLKPPVKGALEKVEEVAKKLEQQHVQEANYVKPGR
jgi:MinD-like ATPase involved in chromosome partitioning or flagellar assembly